MTFEIAFLNNLADLFPSVYIMTLIPRVASLYNL